MLNAIKRVITGLLLAALFLLMFFFLSPRYISLIVIAILGEIIIWEWPKLFDYKKPPFWLLLPWYPILPCIMLIALNQQPYYRPLLLILITLVACHDTGSYIIGSLFGKHKLAPTISPGKTWEGVCGGYFFACLGITIISLIFYKLPPLHMIIKISFIGGTLSVGGDLFESWLKRRAKIKDSGSLLPGHGGFLDRLDGMLFAVFFLYLCKDYLITFFV